jgi:RHS repeat-associated protein
LQEEKLDFEYDILGRLTKETTPQGALAYEYDPLSNLTTLTLPTGQHLNHLYYGSGHLHQLNVDGQLISDFERDDLHREVYRTQGKLTSCFGYDAMGRKAWQFASTLPADKLSQVHNTGINTSLLVNHAYNPIHRRYDYDPAGELTRTIDKLRGEIKYEYEANGQLHSRDTGKLVDSEEFRYDPAANRLNFNSRQFDHVKDNRLKQWRDQEFAYDAWGNLIEKRSGLSRLQTFSYDCENRLVKAETLVNGKLHSTGTYRYDSLGRRVGKTSVIEGKTEHKHFLWQGLRMLREETPGQSSLYVYEPGSYAPLARVDQHEGEEQKLYYFHTDQIGTPLEITDAEGSIVWQATYKAWGAIETLAVNEVEQNLRFQGQYFDDETGLHYNTFRYYDPEVGRFVTQDPIGLLGGSNLYRYAPNPVAWTDPLGWMPLGNPVALGHHMVPHAAATKLGVAPFNSIHNVPAMYWLEPGQWNRVEHSGMHGYNNIAKGTKPLVDASAIRAKGMTNQSWLQSLEAHYNNPEIAHYRGDLRIIENGQPGKILASNVSPSRAWEATKKWARSKGFSMGGCS